MANLDGSTNTSHPTPIITFSELKDLTDVLLANIVTAEEEFQAKAKAVRAGDQQIFDNQKKLIEISEFMQKLQTYTLDLENELEDQMSGIDAAKQTLQHLEQTNLPSFSCDGNGMAEQSSDYVQLMQLLMQCDLELKGNVALCEELQSYRNEAMPRTSPCKLVVEILDCHVRTLTHLEKQMSHLQDGVNTIEESFSSIAKNLGLSSLSTRLHCKLDEEAEI